MSEAPQVLKILSLKFLLFLIHDIDISQIIHLGYSTAEVVKVFPYKPQEFVR